MINGLTFFQAVDNRDINEFITRQRNFRASYLTPFQSFDALCEAVSYDVTRFFHLLIDAFVHFYAAIRKVAAAFLFFYESETKGVKALINEALLESTDGFLKLSFAVLSGLCAIVQLVSQSIVTIGFCLSQLFKAALLPSQQSKKSKEIKLIKTILNELDLQIQSVNLDQLSMQSDINMRFERMRLYEHYPSYQRNAADVRELQAKLGLLSHLYGQFCELMEQYPLVEVTEENLNTAYLWGTWEAIEYHHETVKQAAKILLFEFDSYLKCFDSTYKPIRVEGLKC